MLKVILPDGSSKEFSSGSIPVKEVAAAIGPRLLKAAIAAEVDGKVVGLDYKLTEHVSAFSEWKFNYSHIDVDIDSGDRLKTNIITNAINFGISYNF